MIGVVKAYSTRVGGGPFPTEQDNATGQYLRDRGNEYGTVTRRPRRCGWFDVVALRYTSRLSGVDSIAVMLLDVLSGLDELKICTAYEHRRQAHRRGFPATSTISAASKPVYEIAARLEGRNHGLPVLRRSAGQCAAVSAPHQRARRPARRNGLRRP